MMEKQQVEASGPDKFYNKVLESLQQGKRPLLKLNHNELNMVKKQIRDQLYAGLTDFQKEMAILCHLQQGNTELIPLLYDCYLNSSNESRIFVLRAFEKHSLETMLVKGKKVGEETLEILDHALRSGEPELESYALFLLEQLGMQIILFKSALKNLANRFCWFDKRKKENKLKATVLLKRIPTI